MAKVEYRIITTNSSLVTDKEEVVEEAIRKGYAYVPDWDYGMSSLSECYKGEKREKVRKIVKMEVIWER